MSVVSQVPVHSARESGWSRILVPELWAFLTIGVIWLAVLFTAIYGPDIETRGVAGDWTHVPSVVIVALFAFLATWAVAAHGFRRKA